MSQGVIELYPHQEQFVENLRTALRRSRQIIAQAATGFGKTVVASHIADRVQSKSKRVMFTVHRRDLIRQTQNTFDQFGIDYGVIAAGFKPNYSCPVQIASVQSLARRLEQVPIPHLLVPDEVHLYGSAGCGALLDYYKNAGALFLGLTATPWRLDGTGLGRHFKEIVRGPAMGWLIRNGYLSDYRLFAPSSPKMTGVHTRMGDYVTGELENLMTTKQIMGNAVKHYRALADGKRALVFCVSIKHSHLTVQRFNEAGVAAAHVDGETSDADRLVAFKAFANGQLKVLSNCSLFCEGFDLEAQVDSPAPVEAVIMLRPTKSLTLYLQQVGRGLRKKNEPAIILDHAGNAARHGLPDDLRNWSLAGRKKVDGGAAPVRQCPKCYFTHQPTPSCPNCGFEYPPAPREVDEIEGNLAEILRVHKQKSRAMQKGMAKTFADLVALGRQREYKNPEGWARIVIHARERKRLTGVNKRLAGI